MLIVALVFAALSFICVAVSIHTHYLITVTVGATATTGSSTMNVGILLADKGDDTPLPVYPGNAYCDDLNLLTTKSTCTDYEILSFALYLVWAVGMVFMILAIVASILHWRSGLIWNALGLTFQTVACFGYFFRVMGLQQKVAADFLRGTVSGWSWGWALILALVAILLSFISTLVFALTYRPPDPPKPEEPAPADAATTDANAPTTGADGGAPAAATQGGGAPPPPVGYERSASAGGGQNAAAAPLGASSSSDYVAPRQLPPPRQVPQ
jgi:hypothetical protein